MKKILSLLIVMCILCSIPSTAFAAEPTFTINGVTVSPSSGVSVRNCSAYAGQVLKKIWNYKGVTTTFDSNYNMLKGKTDSEREITEEHVTEFIQSAPLGSRIRISHYSDTSTDNYDNNINGHTLILVAKDDSAGTFTTLEAGGGTAAAKSYTYSSFTQYWRNFKNSTGVVGYCYFFYIADLSSFGHSVPTSPSTSKCTITFDPNGGRVSPTFKALTSGTLLTGMPIPTRSNYTFVGWAMDKIDPNSNVAQSTTIVADGTFTFDKDTILYALWRKDLPANPPQDKTQGKTYSVFFNPNGGSVSQSSKSVTYGAAYGTLPVPTRSGYTFDGWYTSAEGGSLVTSNVTVRLTNDQTLYAHWTKDGILPPLPDGVPDGVYTLAPLCALESRLDVAGADWRDNANVQIHESNGTLAQQWELTHLGDGYYTLICKASGKALDVSQAGTEPGTNVQQFEPNNTYAQQWRITDAADGSSLIIPRVNEELSLDVSGAGNANGTNVQIYTNNGTNAQMWELTPITIFN